MATVRIAEADSHLSHLPLWLIYTEALRSSPSYPFYLNSPKTCGPYVAAGIVMIMIIRDYFLFGSNGKYFRRWMECCRLSNYCPSALPVGEKYQ